MGAEYPSINECPSHVSSPSHRTGFVTVRTSCYNAKLLFMFSLFHMHQHTTPFHSIFHHELR